jgi:aspartyl-tRNA(Asn)/glutamyl-tRNA(Gln) amidotransferase subunit A
MSDALTDLSVAELARAIRARETTAVAVTEAHLGRLRTDGGRCHAFATVTAEGALADARAADDALRSGRGGPLAGIPVAVKDLLHVRGVVRGNGSPAFADAPPAERDATAVARLRAAGAVILGTTHMHELAFGPTGVNPFLGTPVNPWGEERVPGGSSSGSGVAVGSRLAPLALGSDTGGSIRVPASFCGISGLKPTYGRVSRAGATPLAWSLDHIGPMARTVEDLALALQVLAGHDPADPASARVPVPDYAAGLGSGLRGTRIGVPRHFALAIVDPEVARALEAALAHLAAAGASVRDVVIPALDHSGPALGAVIISEAGAALRPLLGERFARVGVDIRIYLELAKLVSAETYLAAQRYRSRLYDETLAALGEVDLLALPVVALPPPRADELQVRVGSSEVGAVEAIARLTGPFNLTGLPALALPCGFTAAGLPVGLQLVGRPFAEARLLAAGHAYQQTTDWHRRRPPG